MLEERRRVRSWAFRIAAATVVPLALLGAIEISLRLLGAGHDAAFTVPCEPAGVPSYCDNPRFAWRVFPPAIARTPQPFAFPRDKAEGVYRVFVVGGSAAQGDPDPTYGFSRQLELLLADRYPGTRFEVVNAGITAINSHVVLPIVRDLARRDPDLFVVYLGNNEVVGPYGPGTVFAPASSSLGLVRASVFLRGTRLGQLLAGAAAAAGGGPSVWRGMTMFVDRTVHADDPRMASVYAHYASNLRSIVAAARSGGAEVVLSTIATNLRDNPPFASPSAAGLDPDARARWQRAFDRGVAHAAAGETARALAAWAEAEAIDDDPAELHFRIATAHLALGDAATARARFAWARDRDGLRFRADTRINEIIRDVARAEGVTLVDAERAFEAASPHGLPGAELFLEHVHFTFRGNWVLAAAMLDGVAAAVPPSIAAAATGRPALDETTCRARLAYTATDERRVLDLILRRMNALPFTDAFDAERERLQRARKLAREEGGRWPEREYAAALALRPSDPWLRANWGRVLEQAGRRAEAEKEYRAHLDLLPHSAYVRADLADLLAREGRFEQAVVECEQVISILPGESRAYATLAHALEELGRRDESLETLDLLARFDPSRSAAGVREIAGDVLERDAARAALLYERAVRLFERSGDPPDPGLWSALGAALRSAGRTDEARAALDRALALYDAELAKPEPGPAAHRGRANVAGLLDRLDE